MISPLFQRVKSFYIMSVFNNPNLKDSIHIIACILFGFAFFILLVAMD